MPSIITDAGRQFIAGALAAQPPAAVVITTVKFANPAFANPASPPAPGAAMTDLDAPIVHTAPVSGVGQVDPDNVVYSAYLDTGVGDFQITQVGYYADDGIGGLVLVMVSNIPPVYKRRNAAGQTGNNYKHSEILSILGATEATQVTVPPQAWQLDLSDEFMRRPAWDVVVGSQAQVDAGWATHTIAQLGNAVVPAGARVLLLAGTHALVASLVLSNPDLVIEGESAEAVLALGPWGLTLGGARTQARLRISRSTGTVTVSGPGSRFIGIDLDIAAVAVAAGASAETTGPNGGSKRTGASTVIETTELAIRDNLVRLNQGETGAGVSLGSAGLEVERGSLADARLVFDEATDAWQAGVAGAMQAIAPLESPVFTGTPTAPTSASADNGTRLASTAFVKGLIGLAGYIAGLDAGGKLAQDVDAARLTAGILPAARFNDTAHGNRAGGALHALATAAVAGFMAAADKAKLDGIEAGATADQSAAEILAALLTVDGVASGLDADLLDGQQGAYYLNAGNLNAGTLSAARFDDTAHGNRGGAALHALATAVVAGFMPAADKAKLDGIEAGATADQTAAEILAALLTVDGAASGLDADLVDGLQADSLLRSDADDEATGRQVFRGGSHAFDGTGSRGAIEVRGPDNLSPAILCLHRPGAFAAYLGLDTDNQLKLGGWSLGAGKYKLWSENNDGAASGLDADLLDGQQGSFYQDAGNLNAGTLALAQIPTPLTGKDADTVDGYHASALEKMASKGAANGYAGLDGGAKVPVANIPDLDAAKITTGTLDDARIPAGIARDSEVTAAIAGHEGAADPHAGYQKESEKGAANGYASLDVAGDVPDAQIPNLSAGKITSGSFPQARIEAGAVGQTQLKTAYGNVSTLSATSVRLTLPGGEYGFFPALFHGQAGQTATWDGNPVSSSTTDQQLSASLYLKSSSAAVAAYARQRYIQASPPYDLGDGEVPLFVFALLKRDGTVRAVYSAPDPPWANNGPTDIRPTHFRDGRPIQRRRVRPLRPARAGRAAMEAWLEAVCRCETEEIEVTAALKNSDMGLIPHPFLGNDIGGQSVVLLDPVAPLTRHLLALHEAGESVNGLLHEDWLRIDNNALRRNCPPGVIACPAKWRNSR